MEKIFKKSLALVLSAALCLTAFVGCLTVSAADETTTPIYEMVGAEGKAGETVTVTAKLQNIEGICAHHVKFTFAKELTVVSMHDVTRDKPVKFDTDVAEGENFQFKKSIDTNTGVTTVEDVNILNFVKSDNTYDEHTPSLTLTFSVKIADGTADGNYAVNVTATAADQGEAWVNTIDFRNSNVVVKNTVAPVEPVVDENIALVNSYVQVNASLNFVLMLDKTTVQSYAKHEVEFSRVGFNSTYMKTDFSELQTTPATSYGKSEYYMFSGIGMYELNMPLKATVKCYDANENYVAYRIFEFNMIEMLKSIYDNSSTAASLKATVADLVIMATEAQKYFAKEGNDLYSVALPTTIFDPTSTTVFDGDELTKLVEVNPNGAANLGASLKGNPSTYWIISNLGSYDRSKLSFEVSYTNGLNNQLVSETINGSDMVKYGNNYYWVFNKIAFYDLDKPVTGKVYYDGGTEPVLTISTTVENYISEHYNDTNNTQVPLLIAMAKFSKSARAHFIK